MKVYGEDDVSAAALEDRRIAVIGYGSQGRAHAQNLRDSGHDVVAGVRKGGKGWTNARADKIETAEPAEAIEGADLIAFLTPDMAQEAIFNDIIAPNAKKSATLLFAHGFSIHYGRVKPRADMDVVLVAPKGPGDLVRREFIRGRGVPALFAVHQDATETARSRAMAYAKGIGGASGGLIETTFAEETETDLFGEQAVLCGGAKELVMAGYQTLVDAGYQPEVAYFECMHELKLIVDLFYEGGISKMHDFISETAKYGAVASGPRIITEETRGRMREVLKDIQSGNFARDWILENQAGKPRYTAMLNADRNHPIEKTGAELRSRMAWLKQPTNA
ncbi:ketol-acid reductoisomerase [Candidatus Viadribacter manganicus]|uniref:Ketol-acid reductoisomerase (NADP(+)) n=1 Tax=Candidatus Viadribacter manganicus TaxID=1759059 RepID=A0A1B1AIG4_9PROT|nr:ketol-acid reductoisomerase [Candidatus Viadribacter manganicus]ANP46357.1 ketol-acid reductoisomerase [Candidatus Viadribacter manganicus]